MAAKPPTKPSPLDVDQAILDKLTPNEVAEVYRYPKPLRRKAARNIQYRYIDGVIKLPKSEWCERCKGDGWPCWLDTREPSSKARFGEFRRACLTCHHQKCSFTELKRDTYDAEAGKLASMSATAASPGPAIPRTTRAAGKGKGKGKGRAEPMGKAAAVSTSKTTTPIKQQTVSKATKSAGPSQTQPEEEEEDDYQGDDYEEEEGGGNDPAEEDDLDFEIISVKEEEDQSPSPGRYDPPQHDPPASSNSRSKGKGRMHAPPTPVSLPEPHIELESRPRKRPRRSSITYRMVGLRDPDATTWPSPNDAFYNVQGNLYDKGINWTVESPFEEEDDDYLRPADVGRIPFLTRVVNIEDSIAALINSIPDRKVGNERFLPGYMYFPRGRCITCEQDDTPCILTDIRAPPQGGRYPPFVSMIPLPSCLGCQKRKEPCMWMCRSPAQNLRVKLHAVAWPKVMPVSPNDSNSCFDERAVWFDPDEAEVV